jgi:hypothetical protein
VRSKKPARFECGSHARFGRCGFVVDIGRLLFSPAFIVPRNAPVPKCSTRNVAAWSSRPTPRGNPCTLSVHGCGKSWPSSTKADESGRQVSDPSGGLARPHWSYDRPLRSTVNLTSGKVGEIKAFCCDS